MKRVLFILSLFAIGCNDFDPRSLLQAPRVVGLVAEPPALRLGETVTLTAIEYNPIEVERTWSVCLISLGAFGDYACLDESLVLPIEETSASVDFTVDNRILTTLATYFSQNQETIEDECGTACTARDGSEREYFDLQINLSSRWADGGEMETVKQVRVHFTDEPPNTNPVIRTIVIDGDVMTDTLNPATKHRFEIDVDPSNLETFVDSGGRTISEDATTTWYTTIGRWEVPVTFGRLQTTELVMPKTTDKTDATIMAVVRDGRGGTDFRILDLDVDPN